MSDETAARGSGETENRLAKILLAASVVAFAACLPLPAFTMAANGYTYANPAYEELLFGWLGPFIGVWEWYANPILLFSWLLLRKRFFGLGAISAAVSLVVASGFLLRSTLIVNEAGHVGRIVSVDLGYWCWIASIGVALLGNAACFVRARAASD